MNILGISAFYHDSSAVLVCDGEIVCAGQEERWTRKKHDPGFPIHSIQFCLEQLLSKEEKKDTFFYQKALEKIHYIAYYDKPFLTFERLLETYMDYAPLRGFVSFKNAIPIWLAGKLNIKARIKKELKKHFLVSKHKVPEILFNYHHLSHAASAFYPSPYSKSAILCLDGVGEWATTSAWVGQDSTIKPLWQIDFPHSLGLFYSTFTEYCGFKVNSGEYKLMGLAPYGEPQFVNLLKDHVIAIKPDGSFNLNMQCFDYPHSQQMGSAFLHKLLKHPPRKENLETDINIHYMNIASSVQKIVEEVVLKLSTTLYKHTNLDTLCMAGGVALNCVANEKILAKSPFKHLWIQPAAGDAGGALGAALGVWHAFLKKPRKIKKPDSMKGALLGPRYFSTDVEAMLSKQKGAVWVKYQEFSQLMEDTIEHIISGKVVGWFQEAMEWGPRALGCRSILGDPRISSMQKTINQKIKFRESFRPFAISILEKHLGDFFLPHIQPSPYMLLVSYILDAHTYRNQQSDSKNNVSKKHNSLSFDSFLHQLKTKVTKGLEKKKLIRSPLPAVTHVDYSCRIQTVGENASLRYRKLLQVFYEKTNCPGLINTSFNVRGEPIVCSPYHAYRCFMNTNMDVLVMGDFILLKEMQKTGFKDTYIKDLNKD